MNVDSDDLYPVFVSAVAANYDSGFAGMPTLTDLVEAMRPIEDQVACSHQVEGLLVCVIRRSYARTMLYARAEVATPAPDRFIRQLVSHLGHKIKAEWQSDSTAVIAVEDGQCRLTTGTELLVLEATADSTQGLAHIQDVVGRHLERFGARAALRVQWRDDGPAIQA